VLAATDFFTAEVWTCAGLITYYVLVFIRLQTRQVYLAGITPHPTEAWMQQMGRNVTMAEVGFLNGCRYLLHDRDTKFTSGIGAFTCPEPEPECHLCIPLHEHW